MTYLFIKNPDAMKFIHPPAYELGLMNLLSLRNQC